VVARPQREFSLAEVLGALSLATDLANGNPMESALRSCLLAVELARELGLSADQAWAAYYTALLRHIGCTSFAHEEARVFGDELAMRRALAPTETGRISQRVRATLPELGKGQGVARRGRALAKAMLGARTLEHEGATARCEVAMRMATRIGLGPAVAEALDQMYERWDGKGLCRGLEGNGISLVARIGHVAIEVELHHRLSGPTGACTMVRRRSGRHFDPAIATTFLRRADDLLAGLESPSTWDAVLAAEPPGASHAAGIDQIIEAFADYIDLKSVYTLGHSSGVAALAVAAGRRMGLGDEECRLLRRAALIHDLGRASVPTGVWEKKGKLTVGEWEQVRLHSYFTERILSRSPILSALAPIAAADHERVDGSGYPRSVSAPLLGVSARILAAADVYQALTEARPHRVAAGPEDAARTLEAEVAAGRLDRHAVLAVLEAAGHRRSRAGRTSPAGLTEREVEVLRLLARGRSNKEIAKALEISARTAQHHVIHIYQKTGVSSRAAAALFAVEHDLLAP
jgi:HD-GYP domain-containing protein (c-di-GMP phosphodiesterase class II)